jgi:protein-S-isoprenylcysteine O-methyltransferase Ste14
MQIQNGILTAILFLGYLLLWYVKRKEILKAEGVDVNVIFKAKRPIQRYFGVLEKIMTISIALIIIIHVIFKNRLAATNYIDFMDNPLFIAIGFLTGIMGLLICRIAQVTIGKSWRVGIDEDAEPGLITDGIYKYVRNPTYTGLYLLCIGVWIINPTFLYSYWILAFFIMMEFQVRCEEEYLECKYGIEYLDYYKKTKRYIPRIY